MAIGVKCQPDRGVTEEVLDKLRVRPCQQLQGGARVAQTVERDGRQAYVFGQSLEGVDDRMRQQWFAHLRVKNRPLYERVAKASRSEVIHTPYAPPGANAIFESFAGSLQRECVDNMLVIGWLQLIRILKEYTSYFNLPRPHTGTPRRTPA
jgi:Integrase core domain